MEKQAQEMKSLRWYDYLSINLFWLGLNIRNTAVGSVFMPYLVDMFVSPDVKNTALGIMRTVGLIVAMLVQPAMGLISDRSRSRFGRRRPFIVAGALLDVVFLAAIGLSGSYWALFVVLLFQQFAANISHGPLQGLIPDLVPEAQRGRASAVKAIFELLPLILVAFTISKLVATERVGWAIAATAGAVLGTMLLTVLAVREEPLREQPAGSIRAPMLRVLGMLGGIGVGAAAGLSAGGLAGLLAWLIARPLSGPQAAQMVGVGVGGLVAMLAGVGVGVWAGALGTLGEEARRNASFTWWVVNRLLFLAAVTSIQGFAPFFLMSAFGLERGAAIDLNANLIMAVGLFTIAAALPGGWLADRIGSRRLTAAAGIVAAFGTLILLTTTLIPNLGLMYLAGSIIGLGTGVFMTANWALGAGLAPREEAGRYLGISNLAGAGAGMIGSGIGGPVADWLNRLQPGMGYFAIFACYAVMFLLSALILVRVRGEKTGRLAEGHLESV
jgi:Na+/melibiose symporter-like transporter